MKRELYSVRLFPAEVELSKEKYKKSLREIVEHCMRAQFTEEDNEYLEIKRLQQNTQKNAQELYEKKIKFKEKHGKDPETIHQKIITEVDEDDIIG